MQGGSPALVRRLPPRLGQAIAWASARWPGRMALGSAAIAVRVELFDRSMTIAAQFFTSVFPIIIVISTWLRDDTALADLVRVPEATRSALDEALGPASDNVAFGVVGALIVLASATSLSRALTRAFAAIWELPRPTARLTSAWRWVAVVLALAIATLAAGTLGRFAQDLPPATLWRLVATAAFDLGLSCFVPWMLLAGQVRARHLLPGAFLFAAVMLVVRPASAVWVPHALSISADRYGSIGVAFTYLAWLYVIAFTLLTTSVVGRVVTTDPSRLGAWVRGPHEVSATAVRGGPG